MRRLSAVERIQVYERLDPDSKVIAVKGGRDGRLSRALVYSPDRQTGGYGGRVYRVS
jgi:hypothetical protein